MLWVYASVRGRKHTPITSVLPCSKGFTSFKGMKHIRIESTKFPQMIRNQIEPTTWLQEYLSRVQGEYEEQQYGLWKTMVWSRDRRNTTVIFLPNSFSLSLILLNATSILVNSLKTKRLRLHTQKQSKHVASNSWNILY